MEESVEILKGLRHLYEEHHNVTITDDGIEAAVRLSARYINDRFLPDKAIDLLDEASAKCRLGMIHKTEEIRELKREIQQVQLELEDALSIGDIEAAKERKEYKASLEEKCDKAEKKNHKTPKNRIPVVGEDQIAEELYISTETVKRHMSTIFEKLGIESRKQLKEVTIKI